MLELRPCLGWFHVSGFNWKLRLKSKSLFLKDNVSTFHTNQNGFLQEVMLLWFSN